MGDRLGTPGVVGFFIFRQTCQNLNLLPLISSATMMKSKSSSFSILFHSSFEHTAFLATWRIDVSEHTTFLDHFTFSQSYMNIPRFWLS